MMSGTLAFLSLVVAMAQGADQPARSPARATPKVDLAPSIPLAVVPADGNVKYFAKLFVRPTPTAQTGTAPLVAGPEKALPRVVCGMVVIPASPAVDPKIVVLPPPDAGDSKIRRIVPNICTQ
jgi:hypothetical protein